uniref:NADAR domain-containing protein n=1 Tax=Panagrolaimus sp. JU765 TaxID=591449 RepID=A0AC34QY45_9BILA
MFRDDLLASSSDDEGKESTSETRRITMDEKAVASKISNSRKRPYSYSPFPDKKVYSTPEAKKRRSEKLSTTSIMLASLEYHEMDLKFDETVTEEIPAGSGFDLVNVVEDDDIFDDLDAEYLSAKKRLSFIGRFIEGRRDYDHPKSIIGVNGRRYLPFFTKRFVFSNHFPSKFVAHGRKFNCSEQYYMYEKARFFGDRDTAEAIMSTVDPRDMKLLGREVLGFNQEKWDSVSLRVMKSACYFKFTQDAELRELLFETAGTVLVEANKIDRLWGAGLDIYDPDMKDETKWPGRNQLGFLLTELRDYLMKKGEYKHEVLKKHS